MSFESFKNLFPAIFGRSGGRKASQPDMPSLDDDTKTWMTPCKPKEARVTIVQITDVYTLDNFASLKTMLQTMRSSQNCDGKSNQVVSMLTGDFLSPYLLSSVDRGAGMMKALANTPIDILTWGNHEADIEHRTVCKHAKNFPGIWINSNMQSHDAMKYQVPYHIIEVESEDGSQKRRIGLVAVLSDDPKLYAHFKAPGAFGGAKIDDPWETLRKYENILKEEEGCDLVIPLEHLYVHENEVTCRDFEFPVILSGHDHHRMDQIINNTRVIKPGQDGVYATVLEIVFEDADMNKPKIRSSFVKVADFEPCPVLKKQTDAAYDVLAPLRNTQLSRIPTQYEPLSSTRARAEVCTMGRLICSMLKASLEQTRAPNEKRVDCCILMGGNIRGGEDYPNGSFFSLEMLEAEIKSDEVIGVVAMPGDVLARGIEFTHAGDPRPGWMQYDDGIKEENGRVVMVAGQPLDRNRIYHVATKISDLTGAQSPPLKDYYSVHKELFPSKGDYINIQAELMGFFSRNLWRRLWDVTGQGLMQYESDDGELSDDTMDPELESQLRLSVLDQDGDGKVSIDDIHYALKHFLGLSVHEEEKTLAEYIHSYADVTDTGMVTVDDFEYFCTGMPKECKPLPKWNMVFPAPLPASAEEAIELRKGMSRRNTEVTADALSDESSSS